MPSAPLRPLPPLSPQPTDDAESVPEPTPPQEEPTPKRPDRRPKLTAEDVRSIRADYAAGKWSQGDLAYIYGVTQSTISAALSGDTHVTTGPTARQEN
ncbi:hypothetical protein [Mycobacterium attenuatum]|uniref:hypothetical protein n=1 Tax=Mycobacterium attenuatum TaxID=2341086 RepID=UPI0010A950BD|nr:hypothetical protein [Mycobacterium attenuatum]